MNKKKLLIFTCCAPCVLPILEYLKDSNLDITLYFDNSNICNKEEFEKRFLQICKISDVYGCKVVKVEYKHEEWIEFLKSNLDLSLDKYVENSERCKKCLYFRTRLSFLFAEENMYDMITSTFLTNMYKDSDFVRETLNNLILNTNIKLFDLNVDKKSFYIKGIELCKKFDIYRQKFCGCEFSM